MSSDECRNTNAKNERRGSRCERREPGQNDADDQSAAGPDLRAIWGREDHHLPAIARRQAQHDPRCHLHDQTRPARGARWRGLLFPGCHLISQTRPGRQFPGTRHRLWQQLWDFKGGSAGQITPGQRCTAQCGCAGRRHHRSPGAPAKRVGSRRHPGRCRRP